MERPEPPARREPPPQAELFGHPVGLFTLFFAEMWERFSYYGMRALLVFYMTKGFLGYNDSQAYTVYGAYTSLVYMTPFFGGMLADRVLGARRAVIFGGLLMAGGHLAMTQESAAWFHAALAMLIVGNGFFKPNISTIVGSLYRDGNPKRDGGFTIFYMGVNLGASMSPLLCGYIGEKYGWHKGFGLATIGMLGGVAVFVAPSFLVQGLLIAAALLTGYGLFGADAAHILGDFPGLGPTSLPQAINLCVMALLVVTGAAAVWSLRNSGNERPTHLGDDEVGGLSRIVTGTIILIGSLLAAGVMAIYHPSHPSSIFMSYFVGVTLVVASIVSCLALVQGGLPASAGMAPAGKNMGAKQWFVYLMSLATIPVFALFVSGFKSFTDKPKGLQFLSEKFLESLAASEQPLVRALKTVLEEISRPAGLILFLAGLGALAFLTLELVKLDKVRRERLLVVMTLTFFSLLFWSFFEQAGSSVNNFTDRNVDRVGETTIIRDVDVGTTLQIQPTQEQLGYTNGDAVFDMQKLTELRKVNNARADFTIDWRVAPDNVGMGIAASKDEIPASAFQSVNPIYILLFGLAFTALWGYLGAIGKDPSIPVKFALGLLQLGLGFAAFWYGARHADARGMVALVWLLVGYLLQTTGELCLSPVGLSMIVKLSPRHLVSTVMGAWFLATAFSQFLGAIIAQFTDVTNADSAAGSIPLPRETLGAYRDVFGQIALCAMASSLICFLLVPLLKRWMHEEAGSDDKALADGNAAL